MSKIYVTGHRNPDTDSIVSAMAYAALRNALGDREFTAARLGEVNDETKLMLKRFGFSPPERLYTVRTQVRDLAYDTPPAISAAVTVNHAWDILQSDARIMALPVANEDGSLYGMLSSGDIAAYDMRSIREPSVERIPLFNLLSALEGHLMNDPLDVDGISGEVSIALPQANLNEVRIDPGSILICGGQPDVIATAIEKGASCVIVCNAEVDIALRGTGKTCIISTPYDAYRAARLIYQSIPVARVCRSKDVVCFHLDDYLDDVRESMLQSRFRSYPVLESDGSIAGTISRFHLIRPKRKRVVLVDHNESAQSVPGLDQADILEIIDHHRLADVQTGAPIYMRNEPVGSTATIIAGMFQEKGVMPSENMAGLIAAAIVSDTVMFKSPTCTERDRRMAERMARISGISLPEIGHAIFSASSSTEKTAQEMLLSDFKDFHIAGHSLGIGQVTCLDAQEVLEREEELLAAMMALKEEKEYDMILLMLTDVLREGTELLFLGETEPIRQAFNVELHGNSVFLPKVVSRKKQIVPMLSLIWG